MLAASRTNPSPDSERLQRPRLHQLMSVDTEVVSLMQSQLAEVDAVLLVDRGVELLLQVQVLQAVQGCCDRLFYLEADSDARAVPVPDGPGPVLDQQWAALLSDYEQVLSWS